MARQDSHRYAWTPSAQLMHDCNLGRLLRALDQPDLPSLVRRADADPEWFWGALLQHYGIRFVQPWERVCDMTRGPAWVRWCPGGTTNIVLSCLDRQMEAGGGEREAIVWNGEDGQVRRWRLAELNDASHRLSNALRALGVKQGDAVGILMPPLPEVAAAFFAIARLGAIVVPLFSGLGISAIAERLNDVGAKALVTADGTRRRGKLIDLKAIADEVCAAVPSLRNVIVARNIGAAVPMVPGRDLAWESACASQPSHGPTAIVDADHPLMIIYTSGTSGRPKGVVHSHIGFLTKTAFDHDVTYDFRPGERVMWLNDPGWLGGPARIVGTTLFGVCNVMVEGAPDYPQTDRLWALAERERVAIMGVTPTLMRSMMSHGAQALDEKDLSALRLVGSAGEPWDSTSWQWTFEHLCRSRVPLLNATGGTEIGGNILSTTLHTPLRSTTVGTAMPGMGADVVDEQGRTVPDGQMGELVLRTPSIGLTRGLHGDPEAYLRHYWSDHEGMWSHKDLATRDVDGLWFLHGRADDTIKVSGKRLGPAEIEGMLFAERAVVDSAVVGVPDPIKGTSIAVVCVPCASAEGAHANADRIRQLVARHVGSSFRPRDVLFVGQLPRTRTGKVMRRAVLAALTGTDPGDLSSLANPESMDELRRVVSAATAGTDIA